MKFNPSEVMVDVPMPGGMVCCSYRMPSGDLHKQRYIGYGRRESVRMFKREIRGLLKGTK